MHLARVLGRVVATKKVESLKGIKLLIVQKVDEFDKKIGEPFIAVDSTSQACIGELVYVIGGREGALALEGWFNPSDFAIVGIVDQIDSTNKKY